MACTDMVFLLDLKKNPERKSRKEKGREVGCCGYLSINPSRHVRVKLGDSKTSEEI
jgi:hypothetical protein